MYLKCTIGNVAWKCYRDEYENVCATYANYLKNKRVVIVGPAPSIDGSMQHDLIESYDVVVRVNEALPIPKGHEEDVGTRTDVLYHCMVEERGRDFAALVDGWKLDFLCSAFPNKRWYVKDNLAFLDRKVACPYRIVPGSLWRMLFKELHSTPNTGTTAMLDLLNHDIKELYITGFTFYQGGYSKRYKDGDDENACKDKMKTVVWLPELEHRQNIQLELLQGLWCADQRIRVDAPLEKILGPRM
ncbi:MAG: glycosyltransferase family 29 protein [Pontiella sp.]